MKPFYFFIFVVCLISVCARPEQGSQESHDCELLNILASGSRRPIFGQDGKHMKDTVKQPGNVSFTLKDENLKGTFFFGRVVMRITRPKENINYDPIHQQLVLSGTVKNLTFTRLYEIVDGQVQIPEFGTHNFSGKGYLNSSAFNVVYSAELDMRVEPKSQLLFLTDLKLHFDFGNATIVAENLAVDGIPVEWEVVNKNIRPLFEKVWKVVYDYMINYYEGFFDALIEGCKLLDLTSLGMTYAKHPEYTDKY